MSNDPHEAGQRTAAFRKDAGDEAYFEALNRALASAHLPARPVDASALPVVYIVGVQRSGTTVLSQLASKHLPLGYINNLISRFWLRPSVGIRLSEALLGPDAGGDIELRSRFGTTADLAGPHEFGYFWRYWLRLDEAATHSPGPADLSRVDWAGLGAALRDEVLAPFGRPVVFKNTVCGLYAPALATIHERSLFVHVERDPLVTAASILKTRLERYGSYDNWWSMKPSTYPFPAGLGPEAQVARQVIDLQREMRQALAQPGVRSLRVDYEKLCEDPALWLDRIAAEIGAWHPGFTRRNLPILPMRAASSLGLPPAMEKALREELERLQAA